MQCCVPAPPNTGPFCYSSFTPTSDNARSTSDSNDHKHHYNAALSQVAGSHAQTLKRGNHRCEGVFNEGWQETHLARRGAAPGACLGSAYLPGWW